MANSFCTSFFIYMQICHVWSFFVCIFLPRYLLLLVSSFLDLPWPFCHEGVFLIGYHGNFQYVFCSLLWQFFLFLEHGNLCAVFIMYIVASLRRLAIQKRDPTYIMANLFFLLFPFSVQGSADWAWRPSKGPAWPFSSRWKASSTERKR